MAKPAKKKPDPLNPKKLSHSSAGVLLGCERRYWHKLFSTPYDFDYNDDQKALRIGKGFHRVLELAKHGAVTKDHFVQALAEENIGHPQERGLILAMVNSYLGLHRKSKLEVIACEIEIGDKHILGYIDAIYVDSNKNWYIGDLKTAGKLAGDLLSRLSDDPQLNLYSFYAPEVAQSLGLDLDKFIGCLYRVTTKATIKMKKDETTSEYAKRIQPKIESYEIGIPRNDAVIKATRDRMENLFERHVEIHSAKVSQTVQNYGNCFNYFRPCPYWSQCRGHTYTVGQHALNIRSSKQMTPTVPESLEIDEAELLLAQL
jgi:hypothetical protein